MDETRSAEPPPPSDAPNDTPAKLTRNTRAVSTDLTPGESQIFPEVPGYEILGILGHGGMGLVYRAPDPVWLVALASASDSGREFPKENSVMRTIHPCTALTLFVFVTGPIEGGPPSRDEGERREKLTADLKAALAAKATAVGKAAALRRAYKAESNPDVRRVVFDHIPSQADAAIDRFLIDVLTGDADAGLRSLAANTLGTHGTDQCLPALAKAAATDKVTEFRMGCIAGKGTARRAAMFAIAELAGRYPKLADQAAAALRQLTPPADPKNWYWLRFALQSVCRRSLIGVKRFLKTAKLFRRYISSLPRSLLHAT